jgi:hypothetical protein
MFDVPTAHPSSTDVLRSAFPQYEHLVTLLVMTTPRKTDEPMLLHTIQSYIDQFPKTIDDPLFNRVHMVVYSPLQQHSQFDQVEGYFRPVESRITFIKGNFTEKDQRQHFAAGLEKVYSSSGSPPASFTMIVEDDFPLCEGEWNQFEKTLTAAAFGSKDARNGYHRPAQPACGAFVGTGGSGLIIQQRWIPTVVDLLRDGSTNPTPADIVIQDCLLGKTAGCHVCKDSLVISPHLIMRHAGYDSSTFEDRSYLPNAFQCHHRHPFEGDPSVVVSP